jgi:hypothetical protein
LTYFRFGKFSLSIPPNFYGLGPFGAHDRETGYDKTILSCFNPLFGASIENDKLNLFLILSYPLFIILILSFCWVSNLIAQNYHTRILFPQAPPSTPTYLQFFLFSLILVLPNQLKWNGINCNFPIDWNGMEELIN